MSNQAVFEKNKICKKGAFMQNAKNASFEISLCKTKELIQKLKCHFCQHNLRHRMLLTQYII